MGVLEDYSLLAIFHPTSDEEIVMKRILLSLCLFAAFFTVSNKAGQLTRTLGGYSFDRDRYEPVSKDYDYNENYDGYGPDAPYYSDYNDVDYEDEECPDGRCSYQEQTGIVTANKYQEPPQYVDYYPSYYRRYPYYLGYRYGPFFGNTYNY